MLLHGYSLLPMLSTVLKLRSSNERGGSHREALLKRVEVYLVSIPAELPNVFQKLIGAHVCGVQTGFMLPGHLRGPGRGLSSQPIICKHSTV